MVFWGETGFPRQWQAEGWEIIPNTDAQIRIPSQLSMRFANPTCGARANDCKQSLK